MSVPIDDIVRVLVPIGDRLLQGNRDQLVAEAHARNTQLEVIREEQRTERAYLRARAAEVHAEIAATQAKLEALRIAKEREIENRLIDLQIERLGRHYEFAGKMLAAAEKVYDTKLAAYISSYRLSVGILQEERSALSKEIEVVRKLRSDFSVPFEVRSQAEDDYYELNKRFIELGREIAKRTHDHEGLVRDLSLDFKMPNSGGPLMIGGET